MYNALIIGCGNIGAMYDFETESILTYAKAFHIDPEITFAVYDTNHQMAEEVAQRYRVEALQILDSKTFNKYDIIAICTPTSTHYDYLCKMLLLGPKLVICEKPVDSNIMNLDKIGDLYRKSNTEVMVNYYRRFQPGIIELRKEINDLNQEDRCTNIVVSYQRGFHNNASHAIDLLEFLFGATFDLSSANVMNKLNDEFDTDPTMSVFCSWNNVNVQFIGLASVEFSHFDIDIYFTRKAVMLKDGCNEIEWYSTARKCGNFYPKLKLLARRTGVVENYMQNVVSQAKNILNGDEKISNLFQSIKISQQILNLQGK